MRCLKGSTWCKASLKKGLYKRVRVQGHCRYCMFSTERINQCKSCSLSKHFLSHGWSFYTLLFFVPLQSRYHTLCCEWHECTLRCCLTPGVRTRERARIQPICFSVMWLPQSTLHIINGPTEPNSSNCIVSVGTDYKVPATALSYKWYRGQMEQALRILSRCHLKMQTAHFLWK